MHVAFARATAHCTQDRHSVGTYTYIILLCTYITCLTSASIYNIIRSGSKGGSRNRLLTNWPIAAGNSSVFEILWRKKFFFTTRTQVRFDLVTYLMCVLQRGLRMRGRRVNPFVERIILLYYYMYARREITCQLSLCGI